MPSPISIYLKKLRVQAGLKQTELAERLGYEQGYVSAVELSVKPPTSEYLERLANTLALSDGVMAEIQIALSESQRRYVLPPKASEATYKLCSEFWKKIDTMPPVLIHVMHCVLHAQEQMAKHTHTEPIRLRRCPKVGAPM